MTGALAAARLDALPPPPFPRLRALLADPPGKEPIDFSIGEPRHAPPEFIREIIDAAFADWRRYPPDLGTEAWADAVRGWLRRRFGLSEARLEREVALLPLSGTREGLFMATLATLNRRSGSAEPPAALLPNPFYQCYAAAAAAAGAEPVYLPATQATGHLPSLELPEALLNRTAGFFLCSPANPQGAVASLDYLTRLLTLAERHDFTVYADECYAEIYRDAPPPSALEAVAAAGADPNRLLVFHSLSKRSNLAGLRSGFVAGGADAIAKVRNARALGGASHPLPLLAAATALWADDGHVAENRARYRRKFEIADGLFTNLANYQSPTAGFFLWLPAGDGERAAAALWREEGLRMLPGAYLSRAARVEGGDAVNPGEGYLRVALVDPEARVEEGLTRLRYGALRLGFWETA